MSGILPTNPQSSSSIWNCFGCCRNGKKSVGKMAHDLTVKTVVKPYKKEGARAKLRGELRKVLPFIDELGAKKLTHRDVSQRTGVSEEIIQKIVQKMGLVDCLGATDDEATIRVIAKKLFSEARKVQPKTVIAQPVVIATAAPAVVVLDEATVQVQTPPLAPAVAVESEKPEARKPEASQPVVSAVIEASVPVVDTVILPKVVAEQVKALAPAAASETAQPIKKKPRGTRELRSLGIDPQKAFALLAQQAKRAKKAN